ncbi:monocarboxylate transporter 13 isoform X2 [Ascaphus truei]
MPASRPPDGGVQGWLVVLSCFLQAGLVFGVLRSFGVFLLEFVEYFGVSSGSVSWVTSSGVAVQQLCSPLGCALALRFGSRPVVMFGGFLSALGMFLASFATSISQLYLCIGGVSGLGWALIFSPSMAAVTRHFSRRRSLATGVSLTGVGALSFALSPLLQFLIESYSWRGAMLLLSALALHSVPCGALLRPLPADPPRTSRPLLWGWELLGNGTFLRYCLAITLVNAGYFVPYAHLVSHMRARGAGERQAALVMSLAGVADVGGRLFAGWLSDLAPRHSLPLLSMWTGVTGVALGLLPLAGQPVGMGAAGVALGFCAGALTPGVFSVLPGLVGDGRVLPAIGLLQMVESVGGLLGAPMSGWLRDLTGDFSLSFAVCGLLLLTGALVLLTLPGVCPRNREASRDPPPRDSTGQSEKDPPPWDSNGQLEKEPPLRNSTGQSEKDIPPWDSTGQPEDPPPRDSTGQPENTPPRDRTNKSPDTYLIVTDTS